MPTLRNAGLTVTASVLAGLAAAFGFLEGVTALADPSGLQQRSAASVSIDQLRAVGVGSVVIGLLLVAICVRAAMAGLVTTPSGVVVRAVTWSRLVPWNRLAGVVPQQVWSGRAWRPAAVTVDGEVVGTGWGTVRRPSVSWMAKLDALRTHRPINDMPAPDVRAVLEQHGRLVANLPAQMAVSAWQSPPSWPEPPAGWAPPYGWLPPREWPQPPADWEWWATAPMPAATADRALVAADVPIEEQPTARWLRWETVVVMVAFLVPAVSGAMVGLIEGIVGNHSINNFPLPLPGHQSISLLILILSYVPLAAAVPVALLLLARSGSPPRRLGLIGRGLLTDIAPAVGLALLSYALVDLIALIFRPLFTSGAANRVHESHVPAYFVVYALILAATTAITEETFVNGYLLTRLAQLGWRPWPAFALSLVLRTSYHAYYGAAIIATVPFGWLVTRSFQRHRRLARPVLAHFLYDATLLTIAVLTS